MAQKGRIIRAISIRQPYVELILRRQKKKEYRSRRCNLRERVWLYAALKPAKNDQAAWHKSRGKPGDFPTGLSVGSVEIVDCRPDKRNGYAYVLRAPRRLTKPKKAFGQPMPCFWRPRFRR